MAQDVPTYVCLQSNLDKSIIQKSQILSMSLAKKFELLLLKSTRGTPPIFPERGQPPFGYTPRKNMGAVSF